jgi:hypothetical protein
MNSMEITIDELSEVKWEPVDDNTWLCSILIRKGKYVHDFQRPKAIYWVKGTYHGICKSCYDTYLLRDIF